MAAENRKKLVREDEGLHIDENIVDFPTLFDGSWNSRGWTATRGIDVAYKSRVCSQCVVMEERKKNGECSMLEYLDWYIRHESNCFANHDGCAQVSILCNKFSLLLQNIRAKFFSHWLLGQFAHVFYKKKIKKMLSNTL